MADGLFAGRYRLAELLGSGGMARVHRAYDTRMGRTVAVKTLLAELAGDPAARGRFAREAQAAGALNHPGIVTVHDQDETADGDTVIPFLVMEYVPGSTLAQLLHDQGSLAPDQAVRIACDMLDALAHAHSHGTVHRDVKPANVMITEEGTVKVADFGIARVLHSGARLTATGSAIGTPSYMSPEQINGADVDARSDVYAVGCVLFELLAGKPPFTEGNPLSLMYRHVHTPPPAPSARDPRLPAELDDLVLAALAKEPADRPATAAAYRDRLRAWLGANSAVSLTGPAVASDAVPEARGAGPAPGRGPRPVPPTPGPPSGSAPSCPYCRPRRTRTPGAPSRNRPWARRCGRPRPGPPRRHRPPPPRSRPPRVPSRPPRVPSPSIRPTRDPRRSRCRRRICPVPHRRSTSRTRRPLLPRRRRAVPPTADAATGSWPVSRSRWWLSV